jgi:glyoxylase-like metal-dependent hydrolase (beta-lactamase superfamily II)
MPNYLCATCGTQFAATDEPPSHCPICEDERQYIGWNGQQWITPEELRAGHHNAVRPADPEHETGLTGIITEPGFAIGQRALLVHTPAGNCLWDCVSLIDDATIAAVQALGGISAIAISHPHFYSSMVEWSRAFDNAPVFLHAADRAHVMRPDPCLVFWEGGSRPLLGALPGSPSGAPGGALTLIRCGGHFAGSTVLHWPAGANGRGALLTGDTIYTVSDRRRVSFMRSYPNLIPLPARAVERIVQAVEPYAFDRLYSAWPGRVVTSNAKAAVQQSAARYLRALQDDTAE